MTRSRFISSLTISCLIIVAGVCLFVIPVDSVKLLGKILGVLGIVSGITHLLVYLFACIGSFEITATTLFGGIISFACGLVLLLWPEIIFPVVQVTLTAWFFLIGGVQLVIMYTYIVTHQKDWVFSLVQAAGNLFFAVLIILLPDAWWWLLATIIAANFVLYGISELLRLLFYQRDINKKIAEYSLPVVVESTMTGRMLDEIKSVIQRRDDASLMTSDQIKPTDDAGIEILVHLSELAGQAWGHVDLVVGGLVFTYGNYDRDRENRHFFGLLWDGVLSVCEREEYIKFSVDTVRKTIVSYTLDLATNDREKLGENIRLFLQDCEPWEPGKKSSYANALLRRGAKVFKIKSGLFHTYFGLNANCALLVKKLLEGTAAPVPRANGGPITPGAVLICYENELKRPGGRVVSRTVYMNKRIVSEEKQKVEKVRRELTDLKNYIDRERNIRNFKK